MDDDTKMGIVIMVAFVLMAVFWFSAGYDSGGDAVADRWCESLDYDYGTWQIWGDEDLKCTTVVFPENE
jgi:hypothetical protein